MLPRLLSSHSSTNLSNTPSASSDRVYLRPYGKQSANINALPDGLFAISKVALNRLQRSSHFDSSGRPIVASLTVDSSLSADPLSEIEHDAINHIEALFSSISKGDYANASELLQMLENKQYSIAPMTAARAFGNFIGKVSKENLGVIRQLANIALHDPNAQSAPDQSVEKILSLLESNDLNQLRQFLLQLRRQEPNNCAAAKALQIVLNKENIQQIETMLRIFVPTSSSTRHTASIAQQSVFPNPSSNATASMVSTTQPPTKTHEFLLALDPTLATSLSMNQHSQELQAEMTSGTPSFLSVAPRPIIKRERRDSDLADLSVPMKRRGIIKEEHETRPSSSSSSSASDRIDPSSLMKRRGMVKEEHDARPFSSSSSRTTDTTAIQTNETALAQAARVAAENKALCMQRQKSWLAAVRIGDIHALKDLSEKDKAAACRIPAETRLEALKMTMQQKNAETIDQLLRHERRIYTSSHTSERFYNGQIQISDIQLSELLSVMAVNEENNEIFEIFLDFLEATSSTIHITFLVANYDKISNKIFTDLLKRCPNDGHIKKHLDKVLINAANNQQVETIKTLIAVKDAQFTRKGLRLAIHYIFKLKASEQKHRLLEALLKTNLCLNTDAVKKLAESIGEDLRVQELFNSYCLRVLGAAPNLN